MINGFFLVYIGILLSSTIFSTDSRSTICNQLGLYRLSIDLRSLQLLQAFRFTLLDELSLD